MSGKDRGRIEIVERKLIDARRIRAVVVGVEREAAGVRPKLRIRAIAV